MPKLSRLFLLVGVLGGVPTWIGCGDSADNKVVVPEVGPAEKSRGSMDAYLKEHPKAAKQSKRTVPQ